MKPRSTILVLTTLMGCVVTLAAAPVRLIATPTGGVAPDVEVDDQGVIHLAYVLGDDVYYARSSDHGKTFGAPIRVNSEAGTAFAGKYRGPDLAVGRNGRIHVIWYNNGYQRKLPQDQWGVMYSHLNDGKKAFVSARNLNHKPSDNYSLAADTEGNLAVFWMAGGLFLSSSTASGETFAEAAKVDGPDTCECCASRALYTPDGSLFCAYRDKTDNIRDMFLAVRIANQNRFVTEKISVTPWQVNGCPMTGTFLAAAKSGLVMAWETKGRVFYTRWQRAGKKSQPREVEIPGRGGKWPVALSAPDGTVLVSWKKGSTLEWQLYDENDKPAGEGQSAPSKNSDRHAGVINRDGSFLLID